MRTRGRPKTAPEGETNDSKKEASGSQPVDAGSGSEDGPDSSASNKSAATVAEKEGGKGVAGDGEKASGEQKRQDFGEQESGDRDDRKRHPHNQQRNRNKQQHNRKQKQHPHQRKNKRQGGRKGRRPPMDFEEKRPLELGGLLGLEPFRESVALEELAVRAEGQGGEEIDFAELYALDLQELKERAIGLEVELGNAPIREEVLDAILAKAYEQNAPVKAVGVIEVMEEGHGLLLQAKDSFRVKSQSVFVPPVLVKQYGLQTGHEVEALLSPKVENSTCPIAVRIRLIMGEDPEAAAKTVPFTELVPYYPLERMFMETKSDAEWDNVSMRVVDLVSPVGFGQRGLIVAQPRTGKTVLLQGIAHAIRENNPDTHLIILLIDERPEEVTDFKRQVEGAEVISSTFDERAESHVH
ncbi:MAG: transcription termination factor Rho, partial [Opitutales bacterium]|nr:transcription termination factor Rho [Opitutales bacterium]